MNAPGKAERRPRILIVDDSRRATRVLGKLLERRGCEVLGQNDPTKAQMRARRFQPDLMILDVCMPWKDGYELAANLAEDDQLRNIPVIMITGYTPQDNAVHRFPVLVKPFLVEDLIATVEKGLHKRLGSPGLS